MTDDRPLLRLTDPGSIVDAVPVLTGFHPHQSVVLMALRPPRRRLGLTVRADLSAAALDPGFVPRTVEALRRDGATGVLLVVFSEDGDVAEALPWRELVTGLADALASADLDVLEQLCVRRGRWFSYSCLRPCCPAGGTPLPAGTSPLAAQAVLDGRVVLPDREALRATLIGCPAGSSEERERQAALLALATGPPPIGRARAGVVERFRSLLPAAGGATGPVPLEPLLSLLVELDSRAARDAVLMTVTDAELPAAVELCTTLLREAAPPWTLVPATMLAWCAWRRGDGALANLAVDRALEVDPGCVLALAVAEALLHGVRADAEMGVLPGRVRRVG